MTERDRDDYNEAAARKAHCWFDVDRVARDPAMTAWKRRARWRQSRWREARGFPIGAHPYGGGADSTPIGSRLELAFARETGANFISTGALDAVRARLAAPETHETLNADRLWADLLSSMPLCFNLFGGVAGNRDAARRAVDAWWPGAPAGNVRVRFEHSPGRRDPTFLGNRSAFDAAFEIHGSDGLRGIVGVETKYHEHALAEPPPKAAALARYLEVTEHSGIFVDGWREQIVGKDLQQIWLDHLLVLAMLQHMSGQWKWGRFVLVYPRANPSFTAVATRYRALLRDGATFEARMLEDLATPDVLGIEVARALGERYLSGSP
jgi:hypothetical protein